MTKGEFALLVAFLEPPGRPLSREHRLPATRMHEHIFDRSIDVQVLRLRRKLEPDPTAPRGGRRILLADEGAGLGLAGRVTPPYASLKLPRARHWLPGIAVPVVRAGPSDPDCKPPLKRAL